MDSIDKLRGKKVTPRYRFCFYLLFKTVAANTDKDTLTDSILQKIILKVPVNKKDSKWLYGSLHLSSVPDDMYHTKQLLQTHSQNSLKYTGNQATKNLSVGKTQCLNDCF